MKLSLLHSSVYAQFYFLSFAMLSVFIKDMKIIFGNP